jgi:hypothetical protein
MSQYSTFVFPAIVPLPLGYDCTFPVDINRLSARLAVPDAELSVVVRRYYEGSIVEESDQRVRFEAGKVVSGAPQELVWLDAGERGESFPSFAEVAIGSADDTPIFYNRQIVTNYSIYTKPGKKTFFSDNSYKYGSPPIITMMAKLGRFVEGYPTVHLDRDRDCGETLTLINPYLRPVLVRIATHDGREPIKMRVPPQSVRPVPLVQLLRQNESRWLGRLQITANNRLITFHIRHSLADSQLISDHEHLDPFRAERTHLPATEAARIALGDAYYSLKREVARRRNA